jgi:WhiB family redox-sensing transcriptional regulator
MPAADRSMRRYYKSFAVPPHTLNAFLPPEWTEQALCAQTDPESFYPEKGEPTANAKKVCARCEVKAECLAYALDNRERYGVWGGLSERERRKLLPPNLSPAFAAHMARLNGKAAS